MGKDEKISDVREETGIMVRRTFSLIGHGNGSADYIISPALEWKYIDKTVN